MLATFPILSPGASPPHPLLQPARAGHAPPPVGGEHSPDRLQRSPAPRGRHPSGEVERRLLQQQPRLPAARRRRVPHLGRRARPHPRPPRHPPPAALRRPGHHPETPPGTAAPLRHRHHHRHPAPRRRLHPAALRPAPDPHPAADRRRPHPRRPRRHLAVPWPPGRAARRLPRHGRPAPRPRPAPAHRPHLRPAPAHPPGPRPRHRRRTGIPLHHHHTPARQCRRPWSHYAGGDHNPR